MNEPEKLVRWEYDHTHQTHTNTRCTHCNYKTSSTQTQPSSLLALGRFMDTYRLHDTRNVSLSQETQLT